jgi:hypothetical protein
MCKAAALLQLATAVAKLWPHGILKSSAAAALAAPTARLAVALMRQSSTEGNSGMKQQPIVAEAAVFTLQMIQELSSLLNARGWREGFAAAHLQPLKACSDFLLLVLLVLDPQLQQPNQAQQRASVDGQQCTAPAGHVKQHQQQQQQQLAAQLLGSSAYNLWLQHLQQHSSTGSIQSTSHVLQHLLEYLVQQPAAPAAAGSGLRLLQWLPAQLLQLAGVYGVTLGTWVAYWRR